MSRWLMCTFHHPAHHRLGAAGRRPEQASLGDAQAPCWAALGQNHTILFRTRVAIRALTQRTKSICTGEQPAELVGRSRASARAESVAQVRS